MQVILVHILLHDVPFLWLLYVELFTFNRKGQKQHLDLDLEKKRKEEKEKEEKC